jgi:hypothetical protein
VALARAARRSGARAAGRAVLAAGLGLAGAAAAVLPRWLRGTGIALAVALLASGVPYLLPWPGGAAAAYVSGPLLLLFIAGRGIALGRPPGRPALRSARERAAAGRQGAR